MDNMAIHGAAHNLKKGNHITSAVEHHAVLNTVKALGKQGFETTISCGCLRHGPCGGRGRAITDKTILITIMHANMKWGPSCL